MQIFLARGTNPSRREAGMRTGLLSKEMIALTPQSDNHEKLTIPGPPKRNHRGDIRGNRHTTRAHTPMHRHIGNKEVGHLQKEISVTRQRYERGTVSGSCPGSGRSRHSLLVHSLMYSRTLLRELVKHNLKLRVEDFQKH